LGSWAGDWIGGRDRIRNWFHRTAGEKLSKGELGGGRGVEKAVKSIEKVSTHGKSRGVKKNGGQAPAARRER